MEQKAHKKEHFAGLSLRNFIKTAAITVGQPVSMQRLDQSRLRPVERPGTLPYPWSRTIKGATYVLKGDNNTITNKWTGSR